MQKSKQNWFQKHKALSAVLATVGFFILLFAILSIGGGSGSSDDPLRVDNSQSGGEASQAEEKFEVSIGETATRNNRTLTVNEVQRNYPGANEYSNPEAGKEYVLITLTLENKDNDSLSFSSSDFKVQDSQGVQTASKYTGEMDGELNFGSLAPGGKVSGKLAFEVPEGDANLKLVYTTDLFSGDEIIVNLGE